MTASIPCRAVGRRGWQGILAITWKQGTLGCAYFDPTARTLFVMDDGRDVRHLDIVETSRPLPALARATRASLTCPATAALRAGGIPLL